MNNGFYYRQQSVMCDTYGLSVRACGRADELTYMRAQVRVGIRI